MIINFIKYKDKMVSRITFVFLITMSSVLFTECKRTSKDESYLGAELKPASGNFFVISGPNGFITTRKSSKGADIIITTPTGGPSGSVNMAKDSVFIEAKFSEKVSWNVQFTGLSSGAKKQIKGVSDSLSKLNTLWGGEPTDIPFFINNEFIVAELTIMGSSASYRDTFKITNPKNYHKIVKNGVTYLVLDDFESSGTNANSPFSQVSVDPFDINVSDYSLSTTKKVSGKESFYFKGFDSNWNGYLVAKTTDVSKTTTFGITDSIPENVYFNLYIYGTGASSATVSLEFFEDEHPDASGLNLKIDDGYLFDVMVNWTGWKLVSIPYSAFKKAPDPNSAGNGNGRKEPQKISAASITLNSYPTPGKTVDAYVDFAIVSVGGPFIP